MSRAFLMCALVCALTGLAVAADMLPEAVRLHGTLMQKIQPPVRSWIGQEARRVVLAGPQTAPDVAAVRAQVRSRFAGQPLGEMDIDALVMLMMMEAAAAEEQATTDALAEMKRVNAEKDRLRALQAEARKQKGAVEENLKARYDSLNDLSQMQSIRLQTMMDRRAKLMETLSNLLKKLSDTQNTLVGNLK